METDRTLERLTAPDYLDGLDGADTAHIRALRDECRAEERRLSYVRRMVQGHLDLATGELDRRGGGHGDALVARVARALTGAAGASRSLRAVGLYAPDDDGGDLDGIGSARLPDLDDDELVAHIDRLRRRERVLSDRRALLLGHLDRLQATLVERYRDGLAAVDDVALRGLDHR